MRRALLALALVLAAAVAHSATLRCGIDNGRLWPTGQVKIEAEALYEHRCGSGHVVWLSGQESNSRTTRARAER